MRVLVVHGQGMEMRGITNVELFGPMTLKEYDAAIHEEAERDGVDAVLINPAGYMTGHPSLAEAIRVSRFPVYELHMSNPAKRGRTSEIGAVCDGVVAGFGIVGYYMGLLAVSRQADD